MFATRNNNENAIYEQQTAAAAKPLNQGVKGLAPKTPGAKAPKTPFKVPLNDENAAFQPGKTGGKGKDGGLFGGEGKGGKAEKSAFVTPAGPRNRAPLGAKTTNAKAFQTPAPPSGSIKADKPSATPKPTSPRLRRAKVKIHTSTEDPLDHDEEREIEYMPPREVPLPDYPDDCWPHDRTYPQFEGKNLTKGWWAESGAQKEYVSDEELSDFEEKCRKAEQRRAEVARKKVAVVRSEGKAPSTLKARGAASALSVPAASRVRSTPSFAAPTAAAKARQPLAPVSKKPAPASLATGNARHTAAKVASNTTLGYSKGRAVSATARKPLSSIHEKPSNYEVVKKPSPKKASSDNGTTFDDLMSISKRSVRGEAVSGGDEEDLGLGIMGAKDLEIGVDDELEDFQLDEPVEL